MKFTLRDLFWLTLLVAMAAGWYATAAQVKFDAEVHKVELRAADDEHAKTRRELDRLVAQLKLIDRELVPKGLVMVDGQLNSTTPEQAQKLLYKRRWGWLPPGKWSFEDEELTPRESTR